MNLSAILKNQQSQLDHVFPNFDLNEIENLIKKILETKSKIITLGVGKNENMAIHLTSLLNSIGITSVNLSVLNALHGDIGVVSDGDILMVLSNSGNTKELLNIIESFKNIYIVGVFCNHNAKLIKFCDQTLILPIGKEVDKFCMIPTTSILVFIIFFNILVSGLVQKKCLEIEEYKTYHPSGNIGKKITFTISDVMKNKTQILLSSKNKPIYQLMFEMCKKRLRCAIIIDDTKFIGIITDGDIRRSVAENKNLYTTLCGEIVNTKPIMANVGDPLQKVINLIKGDYRLISGIPILDKNEIVGLVSQQELINIF